MFIKYNIADIYLKKKRGCVQSFSSKQTNKKKSSTYVIWLRVLMLLLSLNKKIVLVKSNGI